jgi:WD40 repeat protein
MVAGPYEGRNGRVTSITFSPDGTRALSGSVNRVIRVWNVPADDSNVSCFNTHNPVAFLTNAIYHRARQLQFDIRH